MEELQNVNVLFHAEARVDSITEPVIKALKEVGLDNLFIGFESAKDRKQELTPDERSQYNLLLSKYLGSRFMAGYTTSFDGIDRSIFGQYDINRRLNVTYSRSYDLSDKAEDWFGLEYKVGFN